MPGSLELELGMAVNHHVGILGTKPDRLQEQQVPFITEPSLQPNVSLSGERN